MLHKLDFTGEEIGISSKTELEIPIPYSKHSVVQSDIDAVADCLNNKPLTQGKLVNQFEHEISKMVNSNGTVASNSATSSLHLACLALDVKNGDIVWTTPIFIYCICHSSIDVRS